MTEQHTVLGSLLRGAWARFMTTGPDPRLEASIEKLDRASEARLAAIAKGRDDLDEGLDGLADIQ
jgi:hypothetical protein